MAPLPAKWNLRQLEDLQKQKLLHDTYVCASLHESLFKCTDVFVLRLQENTCIPVPLSYYIQIYAPLLPYM